MNRENRKVTERERARFVERAIETGAPLLAARLHARALEQGLDWPEMAAVLGCTEDALNRMACCAPPRPARFESDLREIAALGGVDPERLRRYVGAAGSARADSYLLAAETRAPYDTGEGEETP